MKKSLRNQSAAAAAVLVLAAVTSAAAGLTAAASAAEQKGDKKSPGLTKAEAKERSSFELNQLLAKSGAPRGSGFTTQRIVLDDAEHTSHVAVQQTFRGVPVFGGQAIAHFDKAGEVTSVSDDFAKLGSAPKTKPSITRKKAEKKARKLAGMTKAKSRVLQTPDLWVVPGKNGDKLAWRVLLHSKGKAAPSMPVVFVNAENKKKVLTYDNLQTDTGTGNSNYSGSVSLQTTLSASTYQLKDATRGNSSVNNLNHATSGSGTLMTDADNVWGNGSNANTAAGQQTAAVDAAYAGALTFDYFKNTFGRNGIANNGVGAVSRVHYGNNYVNAYWDGSCFCMTYGDGSGNSHPLTSIDIGGHEMTHGITEKSVPGGLTYSGESGGLNEATSDIFGTAVEFAANNAADPGDYLVGEKVDINGNGTPLRYMDKPSKDGASKDCWSSTLGNVDVHYSSGPANHFFYLLSEGSGAKTINGVAYNSPTCNASTITGIGRTKAAAIWYRALTTYFTSGTKYAAARTATLNAATDLYGAASAEYTATCDTWAAVNVGTPCSGGGTPTTSVLTNGVPVTGLAGAVGTQKLFSLVVPAGATNLSFKTSGGTGDADLYVKAGTQPTTSSYDCRSWASGNNETCTIAAPTATTYYVLLNGYTTYSGATLTGTYTTGSSSNVLTNNVPVTGLSAASGATLGYSLVVPAGKATASFTISGGTGDADLYVKLGSAPTTTSYGCRPYLNGNNETCTFTAPAAGTYYVMIRAYSAFSGVTLLGKYS